MLKLCGFLHSARISFPAFILGAGLVLILQNNAVSEEDGKQKLVLSLPQLIEMAVTDSPELGVNQSDLAAAKSDLEQVKAAFYPQIKSTGVVGPVGDAKEPVIQDNKIFDPSPGTSLSSIGIFGRLDLTATQPVYTFGKLSNRKEAADRGVRAKEMEILGTKNEIALRVTRLYYALILSQGGLEATQDADNFFVDAERRIARLLKLGSTNVSESDLYKVEAFRSDNLRSQAEAKKGADFAYFALKSLIRLPPAKEFVLADESLAMEDRKLSSLETYIQKALSERPEFKQLEEALEAQRLQVKATQSDRYPSIFIAAHGSAAGAPGRDALDNLYISDEFNHAYGTLVAGLEWEFDFGIRRAKIAKAMAEYRKLLHTKASAQMNIPIEVAKSYQEIFEWKAAATAYQKAAVASRKWVVSAISEFDMGIGTADDMLRAIEKYGHNQGRYIEAMFNYNTSVAELEYATGMLIRQMSENK